MPVIAQTGHITSLFFYFFNKAFNLQKLCRVEILVSWKETIVVYFKKVTQKLSGQTGENNHRDHS